MKYDLKQISKYYVARINHFDMRIHLKKRFQLAIWNGLCWDENTEFSYQNSKSTLPIIFPM